MAKAKKTLKAWTNQDVWKVEDALKKAAGRIRAIREKNDTLAAEKLITELCDRIDWLMSLP